MTRLQQNRLDRALAICDAILPRLATHGTLRTTNATFVECRIAGFHFILGGPRWLEAWDAAGKVLRLHWSDAGKVTTCAIRGGEWVKPLLDAIAAATPGAHCPRDPAAMPGEEWFPDCQALEHYWG